VTLSLLVLLSVAAPVQQSSSEPVGPSAASPGAKPGGPPAGQPGAQPGNQRGGQRGGQPAGKSSELDKQIQEQKKELEATKKDLDAKRRRATQLLGKEKTAVKELRRVDQEINVTEKYVKRLTRTEGTLDRQLTVTTGEVRNAREALSLQRDLLAWRLREIYKYGRTRSLEFLLSAESFAQLLARYKYLALVAQSDRRLMEDFDRDRARFEDSEAKLKNQLSDITSLRKEKEHEKTNLVSLRKTKQTTVSKIQNERQSYEEAAKELERAAARTARILEELERRRKEELARKVPTPEWMLYPQFEKNRGLLNWPVSGSVAGRFGNNTHPRFGTTTFNPGIDISAPHGTEIKAVAKGRVDYASWLEGLGNCIILNHGGGYYTLYAHAAEVFVRVGQEVPAGQVIAKVGDSESIKGSCLHFEVRKGKQALNPEQWLR
jgi:septal ring factor EnvC (AmiA/AmiB activator)